MFFFAFPSYMILQKKRTKRTTYRFLLIKRSCAFRIVSAVLSPPISIATAFQLLQQTWRRYIALRTRLSSTVIMYSVISRSFASSSVFFCAIISSIDLVFSTLSCTLLLIPLLQGTASNCGEPAGDSFLIRSSARF